MKKIKMNDALATLLVGGLLLPGVGSADWWTFDDEEKQWSVNVGTRVWVNESEGTGFVGGFGYLVAPGLGFVESEFAFDTSSSMKSDVEATAIPYLSARYGRLFISGSYFSQTSYSFPTQISNVRTYLQPVGAERGTHVATTGGEINTTAQREEWDINVGFYILKGLAITAGYKHADYNFSQHSVYTQTQFDAFLMPTRVLAIDSTSRNTFSGPTIGISGSVPISSGFGLYASYAHGFMNFDHSTSGQGGSVSFSSDNNDYDVGELGVSYTPDLESLAAHLPLSSAAVFAGYRYQRFQSSVTLDGTTFRGSNSNTGFVAGVNLAF